MNPLGSLQNHADSKGDTDLVDSSMMMHGKSRWTGVRSIRRPGEKAVAKAKEPVRMPSQFSVGVEPPFSRKGGSQPTTGGL